MKRNLLLLAMLSMFAFNAVLANETEPNNTKAQANILPLNGSNSGAISPAADVDWYKVTTTSDGRLNVTLNPATSIATYIEIYDNNATTQLAAQYGYSSFTLSVDGLAAGTYYIKVHCYYTTDVVNYTISNTLTTVTQANDIEPDSTRAQALTLPLNGSVTGHINYYYNNHRDSVDWYKVTTNADGRLRLRITSNNGQNVYANLFDNNGTTLFTSQYTSSTLDINTDGLAAGTYYIRINTYYTTEFAPYTLADSLFKPTQANDTEPDSTRAQALTLPLNGSVTGHVNYYYNNHKDSVDWYKVTTNADGRLRLRITSNNGQNVWAYLFDNNGSTQLNAQYTTSTTDINTDGLAAGTYYVRVNTYYTSEFAPYTLTDSLFKPAQANDAEPNSIISQAVTIDTSKTVSGHIGYYYNNHKDTFDWYKLTIPLDGMIKLIISSKDGQNVWAYLFDGDGTTQLNAAYTTTSTIINTDGLAAGTYYIRVNNYYTSEYAPYTLTDSLKQYHYSGNSALNKYFSQGLIIPANGASTGHVGFYYNHKKDTIDTWKINYTGVNGGSMTLTFNQEAHLSDGSIPPTYFQVYSDTNAAPISSNYYYASSGNIVLTNLTQGYYYVKVFEYYNTDFSAYQITTAFTQVNIANISIKTKFNAPDCSPTNSLSFKVEDSKPPYTVKLYRFDTLYATKTVNNSKEFSFINLPYGVYRADAYGAGATGTAYDSYTSTLAAVPDNLSATKIEDTQARLGWSNTQPCVSYYEVEYRPLGTTEWKDRNTTGNISYYYAKSLTPNTTYEWRVIPVDSALGVKGKGNASEISTFKTTSGGARYVQSGNDDAVDKSAMPTASLDPDARAFEVYPNPAVSQFRVQFNSSKTISNVSLSLISINGNMLWSKTNVPAASVNGTLVNVSRLPSGIYLLHVTDHNGNIIASKKVVVSK